MPVGELEAKTRFHKRGIPTLQLGLARGHMRPGAVPFVHEPCSIASIGYYLGMHVHIIAVAGTGMGALAGLLRRITLAGGRVVDDGIVEHGLVSARPEGLS